MDGGLGRGDDGQDRGEARSERAEVAVLGGGSWGSVLAHLAAVNGRRTLLWVRDLEAKDQVNAEHRNRRYLGETPLHPALRATTDLEEAVRRTPLVVFAVPSSAFRLVAREAGAFASGEQVLLSATKGLEPETFRRMSEVLVEETCAKKVGAISGPNLAKELYAGQPAATVVASCYREAIALAARFFHGPQFRVYGNTDLRGVELAGALKNVVAIACGIAHGLGFGDNVRALIITRGLAEVQRLGVKLGADPLTFSGLAGIGDLIVTCSSKLSRNFRVGLGLSQGRPLDRILDELGEVAEGVNTARVAVGLARREDVPLPIVSGVHRMLFEGATPKEVMEDLMTRRARYEIDLDYSAEV